MANDDVELYRRLQKSPILFVEKMWGLVPQPLRPEFREQALNAPFKDFRPDWFEPFQKGKHIAWQQWLLLLAVENAIQGKARRRISARSGHGVGKSCVLAWLILWFLFCFKDAQVPCTAPTSDQMHDVLWKEVAKWLHLMPAPVQVKYEWTTGYLRVTESPETWFARAKTARKEAPEALAGVHAEHVMFIIDEASGVPEEIFNVAEGALTEPNILVIMISNPTRLIGYFYDSHHKDKDAWQTLAFDSEDSPIVDHDFVSRIIKKHGEDSDEYRIRVKGSFPNEESLDEKGYVPLLTAADLRKAPDGELGGSLRMGVDPAGEGSDTTRWVIRDNFRAKLVATEKVSNSKSIARTTLTLIAEYGVQPENIWIDNFGEGANVAQELALSDKHIRVNAVNVGHEADDPVRFLNKRAEAYWRLREWLKRGGELAWREEWEELLTVRYRQELRGGLKIMSKKEMRDMGLPSPDTADALMLTFVDEEGETQVAEQYTPRIREARPREDRAAQFTPRTRP